MGEMVFMSGLPALLGQLCPFLWRREPHPGTKPHCQCGCGSGSLGGVRLDDAAINRTLSRLHPHVLQYNRTVVRRRQRTGNGVQWTFKRNNVIWLVVSLRNAN